MTTALGILGTGSYLPDRVVGNAEVAAAVGVTPDWIEQKTGIVERRRAAPHEAASDLAVRAAAAALDAAGVAPGDLRYVVVATSTPDQPQPATACLVQESLGAYGAAAFDLNAVCSGFLFALGTVQRMLLAEGGGYGLVIGSDVYSRILDHSDRRTAVLFGDGAGAVVVGPVPAGHGLLDLTLRSDGRHHRLIRVAAGGSRLPASAETLAGGEHFFRMDGRGVREYVAEMVPPMLTELLRGHGGASQVDHFVPHQANGVMLADLAAQLGLAAQTRLTVRRYGNTGAASLPVTLDDAVRQGDVRSGDVVLLSAFGGGMAMGGAVERWAGTTNALRAAAS
jgi:3-oxoacyl-[acyl-carrier-protein] synthase-3